MQYQVRNNWLSKQDSNQSMHFICIAFSRRKTRAKSRRAYEELEGSLAFGDFVAIRRKLP
jgi:hypothetical protein